MLQTSNYLEVKRVSVMPCLPLEGSIDLTYRCNNNCRHCWLRIPADSKKSDLELSLGEVRNIVDSAKKMGCRKWSISGGEPMLRKDFVEIFDYITANFNSYSLNTNGSLITPKIARLLKRKGTKMVALYGATAKVHDDITRTPGSFEATMRGFRYLREAGAGFIVQLIPIKDNYHQFKDMVKLAESLSKHYRVGAAWLYGSAYADRSANCSIFSQRLEPREVIVLDQPDLSYEEWADKEVGHCHAGMESHFFSTCISGRRSFHVDPYGFATFCCFIKDPRLRYDLRYGNFSEFWNKFVPSLSTKIKVTKEYEENCGVCKLRKYCRYCHVYSYLEHGRFGAKIDYLCQAAQENKKFHDEWLKKHRRYYEIADITIQIDSDLPINEDTFHPKFKSFEVDSARPDTISLRHHFVLPDLSGKDLGQPVYRKAPWAIYKKDRSWIYLGISPSQGDKRLHRVVIFNHDHSRANIYNDKEEIFRKGNLHSLTIFPTDQILLAHILADRKGFYLHSCGVNFGGKGFLFAGHSGAGKSTMTKMLKGKAQILCDDRMIIRDTPKGFKIYGTWSHGEVPDVSQDQAPLKAILFLEKAKNNRLVKMDDKKEISKRLLACLIRPFVTNDWWEKTLSVIEEVADEIPCYTLYFDKSGKVVDLLKRSF